MGCFFRLIAILLTIALIGVVVVLVFKALSFVVEVLFFVIVPAIIAGLVSVTVIKQLMPKKVKITEISKNELCKYASIKCDFELEPNFIITIAQDEIDTIVSKSIEPFTKLIPFIAIACGIAASYYTGQFMIEKNILSNIVVKTFIKNVKFSMSAKSINYISIIISAIISFIVSLSRSPKNLLSQKIEEKINEGIEGKRETIRKFINLIKKNVSNISEIREYFAIAPYNIDYLENLSHEVANNKCEILNNTDRLIAILENTYQDSTKYLKNISEVANLFIYAQQLLNEAYNKKNRILNWLFPDEKLNQLANQLSSIQLKNLITQEKWESCNNYLSAIIEELENAVGKNKNYENNDSSKDDKSYEEKSDTKTETELEKACRILNVPENASLEQIKKAYRVSASIWHPDSGTVKDDGKMKELNWAKEFLINYKEKEK